MSNKEPINDVEISSLSEDQLWYKAIQEDTIESYRNYIRIFPQGKKAEKALSLIRHYVLLRDKNIWTEAVPPSKKLAGKTKFYPALFFILTIIFITAGLAMWNRSNTANSLKYAGVDSIIVPVGKIKNDTINTITDLFNEDSHVNDPKTEAHILVDSNPGSLNIRENNAGKVVTIKPVEIENKIEIIKDSVVNTKLPVVEVEPVIVKDSISSKEEFKGPLKIPHGLQISVILDEPLSSEDVNKHATSIKLHCAEDIVFDGKTVFVKGAPVTGKIVNVVPSAGRKKAVIGFVIESITAANGASFKLDSQRYHKSASETGKPVSYTEGLVFYAKLKKH